MLRPRDPYSVSVGREILLDSFIASRKLDTFVWLKPWRAFRDYIRADNTVELQGMLKTSYALFDLVSFFGKLTRCAELIEGRLVERHQSLVARVARAPRPLPFAGHHISRAGHHSYRQLVVKQVSVPIFARSAQQPVLELEQLKHQHCIANINPKLAL